MSKTFLYIADGIKRLNFLLSFLSSPLIDKRHIVLVNMCAVRKQHPAHVKSGSGAIDPSFKALLNQIRKLPGVIDVSMRENDIIDPFRVYADFSIQNISLPAHALVKATVKKNLP